MKKTKIDLSSLAGVETLATELRDAILAGRGNEPLTARQKSKLLGCSDRQIFRLQADKDERLAAIVASDTAWRCGVPMQFVASHLNDLADDLADGLPDLASACRELRQRISEERENLPPAPWRARAEALL